MRVTSRQSTYAGSVLSFILVCLLRVALSATAGLAHPQPRLGCDAPSYRFGIVSCNETVKHTFTIRNAGDAPLEIERVRACCGGTARIDTRELASGAETTVAVALTLEGRYGEQKKTFYVISNDPQRPVFGLSLAGTVREGIRPEPRDVDFGALATNDVAERLVRIASCDGKPFSITKVTSTIDCFSGSASGATNAEHVVTIATRPPLPRGVTRGVVQVYTDSEETPRVDIRVVATVAAQIVVVPREVLLREPQSRPQPVIYRMALRSRDRQPFRILDVTLPEPEAKAHVEHVTASVCRLDIHNITPFPDLDGKHVIVRTDHAGGTDITIPVRVVTAAEDEE